MKTRHSRRHAALARGRARGIVSLEFVLVLPFLLMILFGIVDMSLLLSDKAMITNAAGEAARQGAVLRATPLTSSQIQAVATNYLSGRLISSGTATPPTVTVAGPTSVGTGSTPAVTLGTSGGSCPSGASGSPLTVTISYVYNGVVLGSALSALTGPLTVTGSAVKYCE